MTEHNRKPILAVRQVGMVTGSAGGIALSLAQAGAQVVVSDINAEGAREVLSNPASADPEVP